MSSILLLWKDKALIYTPIKRCPLWWIPKILGIIRFSIGKLFVELLLSLLSFELLHVGKGQAENNISLHLKGCSGWMNLAYFVRKVVMLCTLYALLVNMFPPGLFLRRWWYLESMKCVPWILKRVAMWRRYLAQRKRNL